MTSPLNKNSEGGGTELRSYPLRWIILLTVSLLNLSNAMSWIALSPVANTTDEFYGGNASTCFALAFMFVSIPFGLVAMYAEGRCGLRTAILIAAWTNGIGGIIRFISSFLPKPLNLIVGLLGQGIAGTAFAFIMFLPSKVSATWFPNTQRAIATTIALMSNPLGVLLANMIVPRTVSTVADIVYVNLVTGGLAVVVTVLATVCITRSKPETPPSVSASKESLGFFQGLKSCVKNRQYLILTLVVGGGIGLSNSLFTLMQQLLCPSGYSNTFSGYAAALIIVGGIVGGFLSGLFIDWSRRYEETMKTCMVLAVVFGLTFLQLAIRPGLHVWICVLSFLFGSFGVASYPVGLELAAEVTFPVSETTSVGLIVIFGQIQGILYTAIMQFFSKEVKVVDATIEGTQVTEGIHVTAGSQATEEAAKFIRDWEVSTYVMSGIALFLLVTLFLFFHPTYKRAAAERGDKVHMNKQDGRVMFEDV